MLPTEKPLRPLFLLAPLVFALLAGSCGTDDEGPNLGTTDTGSGLDAGTDTGTDVGEDAPVSTCETAEASGVSTTGLLYVDADESERSLWDGGAMGGPDEPVSSLPVTLYGAEGSFDASTCADGSYAFGDLAGDVYVVAPEWPEGTYCRTRNCTKGLGEALSRGRIKLVTFGDSVPVIGTDRRFPTLLAELLQPVAATESVNVAVSGTTSDDWVPGTEYFDERLSPHIASADVIIASLGGNDFLSYTNRSVGGGDVQGAIDGVPAFIREVMGRILDIKDAARAVNPDVDVVYLLYPDYSQSALWEQQFGIAIRIIQPLVAQALEQILDELALEEDIIVVDLYGYVRENDVDLDALLYDQLHFNADGHVMYAERIFEALGGVRVAGGESIGTEARYALQAGQ